MNPPVRSFFSAALVMLVGTQLTGLPAHAAYAFATAQRTEAQSLDGTGNNVANPAWGSVNQPFLRFAKAAYADGVSTPAGAGRPDARTLSNLFSAFSAADIEEGVVNDRDLSAFVYAWGQFLDHDIDLTNLATPKEPFPIAVPAGDTWFDPASTGAMTILLSRSAYAASTSGVRQQVNSISAFIDGSQIYGVDATRAAALREFVGGRLKTSAGDFLPFNTQQLANANDAHRVDDTQLFLAGDVRANENPELTALHTLFVREHNRLAASIAQQHPTWTDEQIFQQARRMVIAELQKITYEDFLPTLIGKRLAAYQGYAPTVNPGIANEFATAAFRFGHSMVGADIEFLDNDGEPISDEVLFRDAFFNPTLVVAHDIDPILKYLASDEAQEVDPMIVEDLRNFLFGAPGQGGFDLAALNIQRGRDHGLADYNTVRAAYGLPRVTRFDQITADKDLQAQLAAAYKSVDDIDLWVGGLIEDRLPGASLGPTFAKIIADQFSRLRAGDRFWYQNVLTGEALSEVERTTLADIIRRNTDLTKLQDNVFFFDDETLAELDAAAAVSQTPQPVPNATRTASRNDQPRNDPAAPPPGNRHHHRPGGPRPPRRP